MGARTIVNKIEYEGDVFYNAVIESIILPSTLKRIEEQTFGSCKNLKNINIPDGVEYIGKKCFLDSGV